MMYIGFGIPSGGEWLIVLLLALMFFGVGKLPAVLGQMGKGVKAFKDGMNEDEKLKELEAEVNMTEAEEVQSRTTTSG